VRSPPLPPPPSPLFPYTTLFRSYEISSPMHKLGWHASDTRELSFHACAVPEGNLLGDRGRGFGQFMEILDGGRISVASMGVGLRSEEHTSELQSRFDLVCRLLLE